MNLSEKEYLELVKIADTKLSYIKNKLVFKRFNSNKGSIYRVQNVHMDISGVDVIHNLLLKYNESFTYELLKAKIPSQIKTIYWENRHAADPAYRQWDNTIGSRARQKEYLKNPVYHENKKAYMREYAKKQRKKFPEITKLKDELKRQLMKKRMEIDPEYKYMIMKKREEKYKKRKEKLENDEDYRTKVKAKQQKSYLDYRERQQKKLKEQNNLI